MCSALVVNLLLFIILLNPTNTMSLPPFLNRTFHPEFASQSWNADTTDKSWRKSLNLTSKENFRPLQLGTVESFGHMKQKTLISLSKDGKFIENMIAHLVRSKAEDSLKRQHWSVGMGPGGK